MRGMTSRHGRGIRRKGATVSRRSGFTLIELTISMSILIIGIVSVASATSRMHALRKFNRETTIAGNALRSMSERIHARSYAFSDDETTWAQNLLGVYGPGGTFGTTFDARGINAANGQVAVGSIQIFTDETLTDAAIGFQLGMPRDLNGDGDTLDGDVTTSARVLPVLLTLTWQGNTGVRTIEHGFYVMGY